MARRAKFTPNPVGIQAAVEELIEATNRIANEVATTAEGKTEDELVAEMQAKGRTTFAPGAGPDEAGWRSIAQQIITQRG